jgi:hypothetical protein
MAAWGSAARRGASHGRGGDAAPLLVLGAEPDPVGVLLPAPFSATGWHWGRAMGSQSGWG